MSQSELNSEFESYLPRDELIYTPRDYSNVNVSVRVYIFSEKFIGFISSE